MSDPQVDTILSQKYPAKQHAKNVVNYLRSKRPSITSGLIYLESAKLLHVEDSDSEAPFRQRRYFYYLSGCPLPDSFLTYNISDQKLTLYIPPADPQSVLWSGLSLAKEEALAKFDVDEVKYSGEELEQDLHSYAARATASDPIFAIKGQVSLCIPQQVEGSLDMRLVKKAIEETRVVKDEYEIALIKKANLVSTEAHHAVMRNIKKFKTESEAYALFLHECVARGAHDQAYSGICASGRAASTLHYVKNKEPLGGKLNLLSDQGAEWDCYASDITRTFPINGQFSKESREIYDIVLEMQKKCIAYTHANVRWEEVHELAHRVAVEGLLKLGILKGNVEDILDARTSCAFFPHGLGHWLGLEVHDTGGYPNYDDPDPMFMYLRVRRKLVKGGVITVEPGIYFSEFVIQPYLDDPKHRKYINKDVLDKYWDVGGVRIEDNILILDHANENLTPTVKEVDDMLKLINGEGC